jgi:hypothetical protein
VLYALPISSSIVCRLRNLIPTFTESYRLF